MRILIVSTHFPSRFHGGGVYMLNLIKELSKKNDIYFISRIEGYEKEEMDNLMKYCAYLKVFNKLKFHKNPIKFIKNYFTEFLLEINNIIKIYDIQIVHIEYTLCGLYSPFIKHKKIVISEVDVLFGSRQTRYQYSKGTSKILNLIKYWIVKKVEMQILKHAELILTRSKDDKLLIKKENNNLNIQVCPIGLKVNEYNKKRNIIKEDSLLFIGNFKHYANIDAVNYFIKNIFPEILLKIPRAKFYIIGKYYEKISMMKSKNIILCGEVSDVKDHFTFYKVFVAPITWGSGIKVKILEAMAAGMPVITTSIGAYGIDAKNNQDIIIENDPIKYAKKTIELLKNTELRDCIGLNGQKHTINNFNISKICKDLEINYKKLINNVDNNS